MGRNGRPAPQMLEIPAETSLLGAVEGSPTSQGKQDLESSGQTLILPSPARTQPVCSRELDTSSTDSPVGKTLLAWSQGPGQHDPDPAVSTAARP